MNKKKLFLIFFILISFFKTNAQGNISFNHLTVENGLSQSAVTCIFQDNKGFMWFGTQDGLNRYDGYKFKIFKNNPSDSQSLTDNFIFSVFEDQSNTLYIETQSGNIHKYNPLTESFIVVPSDSVNLVRVRMKTVKALLVESNGIKWIGGLSAQVGLKREDTKTGQITEYRYDPSNPSGLADDKVYSVYRDSKSNLWIGTFSGLNKLDEKTGKFTHFKNNPGDPNSISDNWVWPVHEDSRGNLWIGTVRGGLNKFDPLTETFTNYKTDTDNPKSINDNFIFSIYEDRSGIIWVGTNTGGVNYFNSASNVFEHFFNRPNDNNSLTDNSVRSMFVDKQGSYWIGTENGGLNKFDYKKKRFTNYSYNPANSNSLLSNHIIEIYEDRSGVLWLGNFSSGLSSFDPKSGSFKHYVNNPSDPNSISDNRIYAVLEDSDRMIWIGTYGGGLNKFDRRTEKFSVFKNNKDDSTAISSNAVWSIVEDNSGNMWIGTFGGGVNVFDRKKQTFRHLKNNPDNPSSIADDNIILLFKDSKGNIWAGTTKGLSRYYKETVSFNNYSEADGLSNNFIFGIAEDNKGNLWLSTNNGLSKFNPETETFTNYYSDDGLQSNEFNQNAYAKDNRTGRMLFGGINGFNVFHPDSIKGNTYLPPVLFTGFTRYNTDDEEGKPIVEKGISDRDKISLTYKDNIVTFEFSALSFFNSPKNQYRYMLEGFNENWIQLGNENKITFTNLSAGDYTLKVIGSNNDGLWNEDGKSLFITVTPPWWKTNYAYTAYGVLFFGFLYGLRRFEINRREQKVRMRENELKLKATEAEKRVIQIENDRKTKELEEARQLQLSMLPKELPVLPHLEIAAFMRTATEVGGDYYDFIVQDNGVLNVAFGDATGHGLQAGTMVTLMKGFFTSDSSKLGLQEFMNHCTKMIKEIKLGRILMSFSYLKIDNNKLSVTSAGMPPMLYFNSQTNETEEILIQGMPLGAMKNFSYKIVEKEIKSGDIILLLSDGLPEQMNSKEEMFDYPQVKSNFIKAAACRPDQIINTLVQAGEDWMNGTVQADDMTFVVIKVK
jgi:ligand-binding sensor domain-containing protein/serine phosphatase RsbU (regulator of sigma subunit)